MARQEVSPAPLQPVAPAEQPDERPDDVLIQQGVEVSALQGEAVQPGAEAARGATTGLAVVRQVLAEGVLEQVVVVQQRRRPNELKCPQAGVAKEVDQSDVT